MVVRERQEICLHLHHLSVFIEKEYVDREEDEQHVEVCPGLILEVEDQSMIAQLSAEHQAKSLAENGPVHFV